MPVWLLRLLPYAAVVLAVLAILGIAEHRGRVAERNAEAARALKDKADAAKERESIDRDTSDDSQRESIDRLRRPD